MYKIYHNPKCQKCREGIKYLEDKKFDFEVVEYMKDSLSENEIEKLLMLLNLKPFDIVRTQEDLAKKPKLIQRPIVVKNNKAVIDRPDEEIEKLK